MNQATPREVAIKGLCENLGLTLSQAATEFSHMAAKCDVLDDSLPVGNGEKALSDMVTSRIAGTPLAHVLGIQEFMDIELSCSPYALVPRPETEILVETVLRIIEPMTDKDLVIGDFGTGTGAIAASIAKSLPGATVIACEACDQAYEMARENLAALELDNVRLVHSRWQDLEMKFDVIVSNPPYVTTALCERMARNGHLHDPLIALDGGQHGLEAINSVLNAASRCLDQEGMIFVEHGVGQYVAVRDLAKNMGLEVTGCHRDLQGLKRVVQATRIA